MINEKNTKEFSENKIKEYTHRLKKVINVNDGARLGVGYIMLSVSIISVSEMVKKRQITPPDALQLLKSIVEKDLSKLPSEMIACEFTRIIKDIDSWASQQ